MDLALKYRKGRLIKPETCFCGDIYGFTASNSFPDDYYSVSYTPYIETRCEPQLESKINV